MGVPLDWQYDIRSGKLLATTLAAASGRRVSKPTSLMLGLLNGQFGSGPVAPQPVPPGLTWRPHVPLLLRSRLWLNSWASVPSCDEPMKPAAMRPPPLLNHVGSDEPPPAALKP